MRAGGGGRGPHAALSWGHRGPFAPESAGGWVGRGPGARPCRSPGLAWSRRLGLGRSAEAFREGGPRAGGGRRAALRFSPRAVKGVAGFRVLTTDYSSGVVAVHLGRAGRTSRTLLFFSESGRWAPAPGACWRRVCGVTAAEDKGASPRAAGRPDSQRVCGFLGAGTGVCARAGRGLSWAGGSCPGAARRDLWPPPSLRGPRASPEDAAVTPPLNRFTCQGHDPNAGPRGFSRGRTQTGGGGGQEGRRGPAPGQ